MKENEIQNQPPDNNEFAPNSGELNTDVADLQSVPQSELEAPSDVPAWPETDVDEEQRKKFGEIVEKEFPAEAPTIVADPNAVIATQQFGDTTVRETLHDDGYSLRTVAEGPEEDDSEPAVLSSEPPAAEFAPKQPDQQLGSEAQRPQEPGEEGKKF